jgi:hypothetical protein
VCVFHMVCVYSGLVCVSNGVCVGWIGVSGLYIARIFCLPRQK